MSLKIEIEKVMAEVECVADAYESLIDQQQDALNSLAELADKYGDENSEIRDIVNSFKGLDSFDNCMTCIGLLGVEWEKA